MLTIEQTAAQDAIAIFQLLSDKLQYETFITEPDPAIQEATLRSAGELLFSKHAERTSKHQILSFLDALRCDKLPEALHNQIVDIFDRWNNPPL